MNLLPNPRVFLGRNDWGSLKWNPRSWKMEPQILKLQAGGGFLFITGITNFPEILLLIILGRMCFSQPIISIIFENPLCHFWLKLLNCKKYGFNFQPFGLWIKKNVGKTAQKLMVFFSKNKYWKTRRDPKSWAFVSSLKKTGCPKKTNTIFSNGVLIIFFENHPKKKAPPWKALVFSHWNSKNSKLAQKWLPNPPDKRGKRIPPFGKGKSSSKLDSLKLT